MQLHADIFAPRRGQKTQRFAFKHQRRIRRIVNDHQIVPLGEIHDARKELRRGTRARRVIRIIQHQHFGSGKHVGRNRCRDRAKSRSPRVSGKIVHQPAVVFRVRAEHRITGRGHQHIIARIDQRRGQNG